MNDNLKAQQVMNDSMSKLRETFQTWLQQRQEQVVNLETYTPEPSQCQKIPIYYDDDDDEENHNLWDVIVNGDLEEEPVLTTGETSAPPTPKTAKQMAARRNQERVKSILLLAIPDEYLLKFHNVADAKSL
ncbi:hypothetical protein Tco_0281415 [Tanacetum coccineum]